MESWSIEIHKDYLKFSAAHFLIFPDGSAERLHGHNYKVYVGVHSHLSAQGLVLNFKEVKPLVRQLCDELDERLLLPGKHPVLTVAARADGSSEIFYRERRYVIPTEEIVVLPISNTSAENLATWIGGEVRARLEKRYPELRLRELEVSVEETPGQRGTYRWQA
jgi:6-pyruvoyltetrahydropterin/6-carboxytetrahydropterin synthase